MTRLYGEQHRVLQDQFDTRKMADRVEQVAMKTEVTGGDKAFIEARDMGQLSALCTPLQEGRAVPLRATGSMRNTAGGMEAY